MANDDSLEIPLSDEMLDRYITGECSERESMVVSQWLQAHPRMRYLAGVIRGEGLDPQVVVEEDDIRHAWSRVMARYGDVRRQSVGKDILRLTPDLSKKEQVAVVREFWRGGRFKAHPLHKTMGYITFGLLVGVVGMLIGSMVQRRQALDMPSNGASKYATRNSERANIILPDGSTVALGVASQLDVPTDYASGNRTVHLRGEALFTVTHHYRAPFVVVAGSTSARVLGTSFMVRHYATDTTTLVAVREGRVIVGGKTLAAAQAVNVGSQGRMLFQPAATSQFDFAIGVLKLDSMPLSQAIVELDRWYAVDIRLGDPSLARVAIEGKFAAGSLSDLKSILTVMLNARIVRDGRVLTLYPQTKS